MLMPLIELWFGASFLSGSSRTLQLPSLSQWRENSGDACRGNTDIEMSNRSDAVGGPSSESEHGARSPAESQGNRAIEEEPTRVTVQWASTCDDNISLTALR